MFNKLFLTTFLATSVFGTTYDLSGVNWNAIDYNSLPFFVLWGGAGENGGLITSERLDPIMTPGVAPSQHLHEFTGSNVIAAGMTAAALSNATCSTFGVKADKSVYWNPALYFQDPSTGEFTLVPGKAGNNRKLYYSYKTAAGQLDSDVEEFPQGFQMITGDPHATTLDTLADCPGVECGYHQMAGKVAAWTCQGTGSGSTQAGFPTGITACPGGLRGQVMFPNCWNGQTFNPANPNAHVAFATGDGIEGCPSTHQTARFPQIYMEINWDIDQFNGKYTSNDSPFVLAFGDKTGYGFHADFMNGWDMGALNAVMKTCRKGDGSNPSSLSDDTCFGKVGGMYSADQVNGCTLAKNSSSKAATTINALPGCQTLFESGSTVDLKTCDSTVPTIALAKRSETKRIAAGHGRFVEAKA